MKSKHSPGSLLTDFPAVRLGSNTLCFVATKEVNLREKVATRQGLNLVGARTKKCNRTFREKRCCTTFFLRVRVGERERENIFL